MVRVIVESNFEDDRVAVSGLAERVRKESLIRGVAFSHNQFGKCFDVTVEKPGLHLGLKAHVGGRVVGFCFAVAGECVIGEGANVVTVIAFATDHSCRSTMLAGKAAVSLQEGVKRWAGQVQASLVMFHVTSAANSAGSDRFFWKLDMTTLRGNYAYVW